MKLGLAIGYSGASLRLPIERIIRAEKLGYDSVWSAEAYGSDAISPLAFIAAHTKRIRLGSGVMQLAARTPANAAMCAATVDALAGGNRFVGCDQSACVYRGAYEAYPARLGCDAACRTDSGKCGNVRRNRRRARRW